MMEGESTIRQRGKAGQGKKKWLKSIFAQFSLTGPYYAISYNEGLSFHGSLVWSPLPPFYNLASIIL